MTTITIKDSRGNILSQRYAFMDIDKMRETLIELYNEELDSFGIERELYEDEVEEYAEFYAIEYEESMFKYCHFEDTSMMGNFANIRQDWDYIPDFVGSEVKPWGRFDEIIKSIDEKTISEEDLAKFHIWAEDWFFTAFGTYNIKYNFGNHISDLEYQRELEEEANSGDAA